MRGGDRARGRRAGRSAPPFPLHARMQAITLEVILRAVFGVGRARAASRCAGRCCDILQRPARRRRSGSRSPGAGSLPRFRALRRLIERTDALLAAEIAERRADAGPRRSARTSSRCWSRPAIDDGAGMDDARAARPADDAAAGRPRDDRDRARLDLRPAVPPSRRARSACARRSTPGEREYLDAVIEEALRLRPVVPFVGRELRQAAALGGYELPAGNGRLPGDLPRPHRPDDLPRALRLPARALPGRAADRDLHLDPVRRRHAALHRRRLRPVRDAGRAARRCSRRVDAASRQPRSPSGSVRRNVTLSPRNGTPRDRASGLVSARARRPERR